MNKKANIAYPFSLRKKNVLLKEFDFIHGSMETTRGLIVHCGKSG